MDIVTEHAGFKGRPRKRPCDMIVVHESVTSSKDTTIQVLLRRGLGVHYLIDVDGTAYQTHDREEYVAHAGVLNKRSVGIEVVHPYYPTRLKPGHGRTVIPARWAHRGSYVVPFQAQLRTLWMLLRSLVNTMDTVPPKWVGLVSVAPLVGSVFAMGRVSGASGMPGIHAHGYTHHADGFFPVLYCYLRALSSDPVVAYDLALETSSGAGRRVSIAREGEGTGWRPTT